MSEFINFTEVSDLNGPTPQFTLTCISTGGPATTVTWTRDSVSITEGTQSVLDDPVTAQYTHTLSVKGRKPGKYRCTVSNNKPSTHSASFTVKGKMNNLVFVAAQTLHKGTSHLCDGSTHSSGCVVNGDSNAMAAF